MEKADFQAILRDTSKRVEGNLSWSRPQPGTPWVKFRANIASEAGYPLQVEGSHNPLAEKTTFTVLYAGKGRIYALDLGGAHKQPDGEMLEGTHKHRLADDGQLEAYVPLDITADPTDPVLAWDEFCAEFNLAHQGELLAPSVQLELEP